MPNQIGRLVPSYFGSALAAETVPSVGLGFGPVWCRSVQLMMNVADTCQAGCRDLEAVYGNTKSWAKIRYRRLFYDLKADVVESGLWTAYNNYPDVDDSPWAFSQACDRYLN